MIVEAQDMGNQTQCVIFWEVFFWGGGSFLISLDMARYVNSEH